MAAEVYFTIDREDIENSFELFDYSDTERYHTVKFSNGNKIGEGNVSFTDIDNGKVDWISEDEEYDWEDAVYDYINGHNEKVFSNSTGNTVEFVVTDIDDRAACTFEKKVNGKIVEQGKGWCKDLNTDTEKEAWRKAVIQYKKDHGLSTATEKIDELIEEINAAIDSLDSEMPGEFNLTPPLIETALPEIGTDPCNFVSDLKKAAGVAIARINGLPSPIELVNYYIKLGKDNIQTAKEIAVNSQSATVKLYTTPVTDKVFDSKSYFERLDAEDQEYKKTHSDDICLFESCLEKPYVYTKTYTYEEMEETSYDGVSIDDINIIDAPASSDFTRTSYKEVEPNIIAKGGSLRSGKPNRNIPQSIYNNIYEALQNCWIPLRIAWESYCKNKDWNPTWTITSGYRPDSASYGSAHGSGWAIDIQPAYKNQEDKKEKVITLASFIYQYCKAHREIKVDQILREYNSEYSTWCHIGYKRPSTKEQRGQYYANYDAKGSHGQCQLV